MMASAICTTLLITGTVSFINPTSSYAAERVVENNMEFRVEKSSSTANTHNFSLVNSDNNIDIDIKYTENSVVTVKTITNGTEEHTFIYNKSDAFATLDGEIMNLEIDEPDFSINSEESLSPRTSTFAAPSSTPVYVSLGNISFSEPVNGLGKIITTIAGVIVIADLLGVSLPKKVIEKKVSNWLTLMGLGSAIALNTFSGSLTYDLYRTKDKFNTGYNGSINQYQYKFRYRDIAVKAVLLGKSMNLYFEEVGSWWFQSKPM